MQRMNDWLWGGHPVDTFVIPSVQLMHRVNLGKENGKIVRARAPGHWSPGCDRGAAHRKSQY